MAFRPEDYERFQGSATMHHWLKMKYAIEGPEAMRSAMKDKLNGIALMSALLISVSFPVCFTDFTNHVDLSEYRVAHSIFVNAMGFGAVCLLCSVISAVYVLDMLCVVMNTKEDLAWWALTRDHSCNTPQNLFFAGAGLMIFAFCIGAYMVLRGRWEAWILIGATAFALVALITWQQLTLRKIFVSHTLNGFRKHDVNHFEAVKSHPSPGCVARGVPPIS